MCSLCRLGGESRQLAGDGREVGVTAGLGRQQHHPAFEAISRSLSIATFRYVPEDLRAERGSAAVETYLNKLNQDLLTRVEKSGEAFLSNAVVGGTFALRACVVNFHTSAEDIDALPALLTLSAGQDQRLAGDPPGVVGRKKHGGAGDVLRLCDSA